MRRNRSQVVFPAQLVREALKQRIVIKDLPPQHALIVGAGRRQVGPIAELGPKPDYPFEVSKSQPHAGDTKDESIKKNLISASRDCLHSPLARRTDGPLNRKVS